MHHSTSSLYTATLAFAVYKIGQSKGARVLMILQPEIHTTAKDKHDTITIVLARHSAASVGRAK